MIGEQVGSYRIVSRLGRSGLGELWNATRADGSPVTVQLLPDGSPASFAASAIEHEHLARVHESGVADGGRPFLVLEPVRGIALADVVQREGRLRSRTVADFAGKIASALDALHAKGVVHRGLSPAGIYIDGAHVTVLDAGLATSVVRGIDGYAAPELWSGDAKPDARSDIYALGCIAFEMATGRAPFLGSTAEELPEKHRTSVPASLASLVPDVTKALDMLVVRMLKKAMDDRPRNAKELSFVFELVENDEKVPSLGSTVKQID